MPFRFWLAVVAGVVLALAPPAHGAGLYALIDTGELYFSADDGSSWAARATLPARDAIGLAAGTSSSQLYLVTRSGSVYRGNIGARNPWTPLGAIASSDVAGFTIAPFGAFLALTSTGTVYDSGDQGTTFTAIATLAGSDWVSLARGPLGRIYALTATGQVAESRDQGATWSTVGVITTSSAVVIGRFRNDLYVLTRTGEIYRSIDYGVSWTAVAALTSSNMTALVDSGDALVGAAAEGEVAASMDGKAWSWVGVVNQLRVVALANDTPLVTGVADRDAAPRFVLRAPYPNPGTSTAGTLFSFSLPSTDLVRVAIYDAQGRRVASRPEEVFAAGDRNEFHWSIQGLAAGTYFVHLDTASGASATSKWIVIR